MTAKRVYDLPTRLFHGLFAACFLIAYTISNTVDDDSRIFSYHMIAGLVLCFLIPWRLLWGVVGSRHARFTDLQLSPKALAAYMRGIFSQNTRLWSGHNPASSWAAISMLLLGLSMGISGLLMVTGTAGESLEDIHELLANAFIIVVLVHIAGVVIHTMKHKDSIGMSMVTGCKQHAPDTDASVVNHTFLGILFLVLTVGFASYLLTNFNTSTGNLSIFGNQIHLGEFEDYNSREHRGDHGNEHDEDD